MSKLLILVVIFIVVGVGIYAFQWWGPWLVEQPQVADKLEEIASTKISEGLALENVKKLPEVEQFLKDVPGGIVEVDNESEGQYNVHVYEIKNGHTATFNWYRVSIKSGEIKPQFEIAPEKESEAPKGTVTGRLCYPSEVLPKGLIEAKRPSDSSIFVQDYPGSGNGGKSNYSFELEEGEYYLRYTISKQFIGYSTTVCPTGQEESCGDKKPRELKTVSVKAGQTVSGYDLCDFYYKDSNAPKF